MKRKRLWMILAAFMLSAALAGCSGGSDGGKEDKSQKQEEKKEQDEDKQKEDAKEEVKEYAPGTVDGNHYESEWMNVRIDLPEGFVMATEEEIANIQEAGVQFLDDEEKDKLNNALDEGTTFYEMMAATLTGSPNVNISVEKLPYKNATAEQYADVTKEVVEKSMTNGMTASFQDGTTDAVLGGQEYKCIAGTANVQAEGVSADLNMDMYIRVQDGYAIVVNITYTADTVAQKDELLAAFQEF